MWTSCCICSLCIELFFQKKFAKKEGKAGGGEGGEGEKGGEKGEKGRRERVREEGGRNPFAKH